MHGRSQDFSLEEGKGARIEAPKAPRGAGFGEGCFDPFPLGARSGECGIKPSRNFFLDFYIKMISCRAFLVR